MKNITREDIAEYINNQFGLSKIDCNNLVNDILEEIIIGLNNEKIVKIHNFGTFKLRKKNERKGRNPKTKEEHKITARNVISFTPSKKILSILNKDLSSSNE